MKINDRIHQLTEYAIRHGLIGEEDRIYAHNRLIEALGLSSYEDSTAPACEALEEILFGYPRICRKKRASSRRQGSVEP